MSHKFNRGDHFPPIDTHNIHGIPVTARRNRVYYLIGQRWLPEVARKRVRLRDGLGWLRVGRANHFRSAAGRVQLWCALSTPVWDVSVIVTYVGGWHGGPDRVAACHRTSPRHVSGLTQVSEG